MEEAIECVGELLVPHVIDMSCILRSRHDFSEMGIVNEISNLERRINQLEMTLLNRYDTESPIRQCAIDVWN